MINTLQNNLGFLGLLVGILALVLSIFSLLQNRKLSRLQRAFFTGKSGINLEDIIVSINQTVKRLEEENSLEAQNIKDLKTELGFTIKKIGLVRYSPFADGGGNYSFSLALLDSHNNGLVITNMYGRQQSRVYTKKITEGKSETTLTEEESQSISMANEQKI